MAARSPMRLLLLGAGANTGNPARHDWAYFLKSLDLLEPDIQIAYVVKIWGAGILLLALLWGSINVESILSEADRLKFAHSFFRIFH